MQFVMHPIFPSEYNFVVQRVIDTVAAVKYLFFSSCNFKLHQCVLVVLLKKGFHYSPQPAPLLKALARFYVSAPWCPVRPFPYERRIPDPKFITFCNSVFYIYLCTSHFRSFLMTMEIINKRRKLLCSIFFSLSIFIWFRSILNRL